MNNVSSRENVAARSAVMPNVVPVNETNAGNKIRNDFIHHPQQFPLEAKRLRSWGRSTRMESSTGDMGLSFVSRKYIPPGSEMELSIPLRGDVQKFHGHVVLVREIVGGYEIGVWLASADEASRARIVEQICQLECSLKPNSGKAAGTDGRAGSQPTAIGAFTQPLTN
ncbi:MAG: hypothetical protein ACU85U_10430 [Gammaproteobacteria bacterium]|jgi:hypothetical protein